MQRSMPAIGLYGNHSRNEWIGGFLSAGLKKKNILQVLNLWAPYVVYMGQAFRYSPENAFYIFNQQIYFIV